MVERREHVGGANIPTLSSGFLAGDPTFVTSPVTGWGTGSVGPFSVRIGKGQPNEEKLLLVSRTGTTFTIAQHGYDGTTAQDHSAGETVEFIGTALELDEANAHIMATDGVHGLPAGHKVLGDLTTQTVKAKTIDGSQNTLLNIPRSASPVIDAKLTALDATNTSQDAAIAAEAAARTAGDAANVAQIGSEATRAQAAEATNAAAITAETARAAPIAAPTFTGAVTLGQDAAAALQAVTKQQLDALIAGRLEWGVSTLSPDANGNVNIPHGAYTPVALLTTAFSGSNPTWAGAFTADIRALGNPSIVQCHHRIDGTPVSTGTVTIHWLAIKP